MLACPQEYVHGMISLERNISVSNTQEKCVCTRVCVEGGEQRKPLIRAGVGQAQPAGRLTFAGAGHEPFARDAE